MRNLFKFSFVFISLGSLRKKKEPLKYPKSVTIEIWACFNFEFFELSKLFELLL